MALSHLSSSLCVSSLMYFSCAGVNWCRGSLEGGTDPVLIQSYALVQWPKSSGPLDTALECLA